MGYPQAAQVAMFTRAKCSSSEWTKQSLSRTVCLRLLNTVNLGWHLEWNLCKIFSDLSLFPQEAWVNKLVLPREKRQQKVRSNHYSFLIWKIEYIVSSHEIDRGLGISQISAWHLLFIGRLCISSLLHFYSVRKGYRTTRWAFNLRPRIMKLARLQYSRGRTGHIQDNRD